MEVETLSWPEAGKTPVTIRSCIWKFITTGGAIQSVRDACEQRDEKCNTESRVQWVLKKSYDESEHVVVLRLNLVMQAFLFRKRS